MIAEMRAVRLELDNQRHFTEEKKPIETVRAFVGRWTETREPEDPQVVAARTASSLRRAADANLFETG